MMTVVEDIYSPESELRRTLTTFKNRVHLWNLGEKMLDREYRPKKYTDLKIDTANKDDMARFIVSNNSRLDTIREQLKIYAHQRRRLNAEES